MRPPVLVTDGEERAALASVRSLARWGCTVHVCSPRRASLAGVSRYATSATRLPDPLSAPDAYADGVAELCRRLGIELLLPITEASLLALLPREGGFGRASVPWPSVHALRKICDKSVVLETARRVGLDIPCQSYLPSPDALDLGDFEGSSFPLVIKPRRSVVQGATGRHKASVAYARDTGELESRIRQLPDWAFPVLLQQRIVGPGLGVFLLLWDDELVAAFAHRRLREKPPSGGVSVYRESIPLEAELLELSRRLLREFEWTGVAMVEFKVDAATGRPYLMEVNGRLWGSLQLAIDAGVDFPRLLVERAIGGEPEPVTEYRLGVRSRWWWGDVDHLLLRLRRNARELALPPDAPRRGRVIAQFLRFWRPGDRFEVFRLSDPRPFKLETVQWLSGALGRTAGR